MARVVRTRSGSASLGSGTAKLYLNNNTTPSSTTTRNWSRVRSITDFHGRPISDGPLNSNQYKGNVPSLFGKAVHSSFSATHTDYENFSSAGIPSAMDLVSVIPAPSGWMLDLVAGTNPSRPVLNIPELVEDLADLPKAIRNLGNLIAHPGSKANPKGFAGEYLGVQFGWIPLIEDLTKLLDFQKYAIKRAKELDQLYSGKGLRRRLKFLDDTTEQQFSTTYTLSGGASIVFKTSLKVKREQWATIHWWPTTPPPYHPGDESNHAFVRRLILGFTPEGFANGLWKVIPWTWLIGWFSNVGKYTLAHSFTVPATHGVGCFMSKAEATLASGEVIPVAITGSFQVEGKGTATYTIKTRAVSSSVTVGANVPYLDTFRLSILGALWVQGTFGKVLSKVANLV